MDIIKAIEENDINVVKRLLKNKDLDLNIKYTENNPKIHHKTLLMYASYIGRKTCVKLLLKEGANPNEQDDDGLTALHHGCFDGHDRCIKLLLKYGADPDAESFEGATPLMMLLDGNDYQKEECLYLLLKAGASVYKKDNEGLSVMNCDINRIEDKQIVKILKRMIIVQILLDY